MKPPRVSIAGLMVLVGFVAANFAAFRAFDFKSPFKTYIYWVVFAPFQTTLLIALLRLTRARGPARMSWGGFLILGSMAFASLLCYATDSGAGYLTSRLWRSYDDLAIAGHDWGMRATRPLPYGTGPVLVWVLVGVAFYLPQLAVGLAGGLIARSIAKVAARRRGSVAAGDDGRGAAVR